MPSAPAIAFWLSPRSRRSRFNRAPRKSLRPDICKVVTGFTEFTSHALTHSHFSVQLFSSRWGLLLSSKGSAGMVDFREVVSAPAGRFDGIERPYSAEDVLRLRGSIHIEHTLARR